MKRFAQNEEEDLLSDDEIPSRFNKINLSFILTEKKIISGMPNKPSEGL